jgi:hypothetical protein
MAAKVTVQITDSIINRQFGGMGFHSFHHSFPLPDTVWNEVVYKRWREINPSFVRLNHHMSWSDSARNRVVRHLNEYRKTGTEVYLTTWDPRDEPDEAGITAYAREVVDDLAYFVRDGQADHLKYYCMSNELSMKGWGLMRNDLPRFKAYHLALFNELKRRNLPVQLLATDASPIVFWPTIEWAARNMDDITGVYGGHHYINDHLLTDTGFYPWFGKVLTQYAGMARAKGKHFIMGEFGAKQDGRMINGVKNDACIYWNTAQEPMVGIQVTEAMIAGLNAGVYAMGYWTFMDFPNPKPGQTYQNKWGIFKWNDNDFSPRAPYYAIGLMTKYFRGPAEVYAVSTGDSLIRCAAVRHPENNSWSVAVINRRSVPVDLEIVMPAGPRTLRRYVYEPARLADLPFADLPPPDGKVFFRGGHLQNTVPASSLIVYTTDFDEVPPAPVKGMKVSKLPDGRVRISWRENREPDMVYYRVYRSEKAGSDSRSSEQIASTIAGHFVAPANHAGKQYHYRVRAVDRSGNESN